MDTLTLCPCGNSALTDGQQCALCEWCADHEGHQTPETVDIFPAWMSGTPVASCRECGMRWGYWECGCELAHDCERSAS